MNVQIKEIKKNIFLWFNVNLTYWLPVVIIIIWLIQCAYNIFLREKKFISWAGGGNEKYTWQAAIAHNDFNDSSLNVYRRKRRWKRRSLVLRSFPCVHSSKITRGSHRMTLGNSINAIRQMCVTYSMYLVIFFKYRGRKICITWI